jgi:sulfate transport system substrate-binding protein
VFGYRSLFLNGAAALAAIIGLSVIFIKNLPAADANQLINVSYDPTRELYQAINPLFIAAYEKKTGDHLTIVQSHGGSSRQARKLISGEQTADVVTLGLFTDVDALRKRGLITQNWADRLPNHSVPYTSTVVFVVRGDNPNNIVDWPDLLKPGLEVVTPDPRTSGNGKFAFLAAWASVITRGGTEEDARTFLTSLYHEHVPVLDEGARGAATTFALEEIGDVHVTWENEALREVAASQGKLKIVYPLISMLAEPEVAWVDAALTTRNKLEQAKAYLNFLFSDAAQETIARLGYRPYKTDALRKAGVSFPDLKLVPITAIAKDWDDAGQKFFDENGIIDTIIGTRKKWVSR